MSARGSIVFPRVAIVLMLVAVLLTATSCLTSDAYLTVNDDGSGELRMDVFPPVEVSGVIDSTKLQELAAESLEGMDGASFTVDERRGQLVYSLKIPFEDVRQLTVDIADGTTVAGQRFTPFERFDLRELPDGGWTLSATTNPLDQAVVFNVEAPLFGLRQLAATPDAGTGLTLSVTLPGRLVDSNADTQVDNRAEWKLTDPGASYELQMRTESQPLLSALQWLLLGLLGLFVLGGVLMLMGSRGPVRRRGFGIRTPGHGDHTTGSAAQKSEPPGKTRRPRRRKRPDKSAKTGWENPGEPTARGDEAVVRPDTADSELESHHRLPPLSSGNPPNADDGGFGNAPSVGGSHRPPNLLPLAPESNPHHPDEDR